MISRIFELARKSGAAASALQSLESEHKRISEEMLEQDSSNVSRSDLDRAEAELAQVRREVELNRLELGALGDSLRRSQQFAQSQLESTQAVFEVAKTKHDQGIAPSEELIRVKRELSRAQERLEEAKANLMQLDRALSLVQGDQNLGNDSQSDSDREQEIREEVPEPNSNTDQPE